VPVPKTGPRSTLARLTKTDRTLLLILLPLFAVSLSLHIREVLRTGFAQPPVFAVPGEGSEAYPVVGGLRLERGIEWNDLNVGDTLVRVGSADLRGVGYAGFDAIALEQAGRERETPLVLERDGARREIGLRMVPHDRPWFRVPFLLSFVLVSLLILLRAPGSRHAQALFAGFASFAIAECHFFGGPRLQSYVSIYLFNFGGSVAVFLMFRWLLLFPDEVDPRDRLSPKWAWLACLWILVRLNYFLGGPVPSGAVPGTVLAVDSFFALMGLSIATWNYFHANRIGRRRFKWLVLGAYVSTIPWLATSLASYVGLPQLAFHQMFEILMLVQVSLPVGILIAVARFNLFDVDRLLSSTASYTIAVAALAGVTFSAVPAAAGALAQLTGWSPTAFHGPLAIGLVGVGLLLGRRLRPRIDRVFFPERLALQDGIARLLKDLDNCRSAEEVVSLVQTRVSVTARATHATALARRAGGFETRGESEGSEQIFLADESQLVRELAANPLAREFGNVERAALHPLDARVLLPLRSGTDLFAIIALGEKQSGDIYTRTEITLLGSVCERASAELLKLRDAAALAKERVRGNELEGLKERAESTNLSRARFLAAASHDLRQPLHALGLFASTLSERLGEADAPALVERIQISTESLSEMLDALLDMSRLDGGSIEPNITDFEIGPVLERLASELEPSARAKGLSLTLPATKELVRSDPVLLGRILQNLLTNAVRYTDSGGVTIRCNESGPDLRIEVADTGRGIPDAQHQNVFQEFVRIEEDSSDGGLGLGLSIAARMAQLLGHELSLESTPGSGSTFAISVERASASALPSASSVPIDFSGRLVAVLDDDLSVLEGTRSLLEQWGCEVWLARSVEEAVEINQSSRAPDAILVDYRLGNDETGLEAVQRLNAMFDVPVPAAVITGETTREVLEEIRASGFVHLTKPVAAFKLRATLMELLRPRVA
jgi:signal transduction histidine kinase/CheY-like chemotaxis protein